MEAAEKPHPSLPENYVTLLDLRERWMEQQKQKKREECTQDKVIESNVEFQDYQERVDAEGEDKVVDDGDQLEQHPPVEKSVVRSNPNPKPATRRPSRGHRRLTESRNCRWVQVSQPKSPPNQPKEAPVVTVIQPKKQAPSVQASHSKPAPVVQVAEQKGEPMLPANQSKPPRLESPKAESAIEPRGEIPGSDGKIDDRKLVGAKMEKKKRRVPKTSRDRKNQKRKDVVESQEEKGVLTLNAHPDEENLEQGVVFGREKKDEDDISKAEIEGELAGLSLNNGAGESSSGRSMAVRNRRGWRKDGGYGKFERRVILKKERAKAESGLVWIKKGEASEMDVVPVEKAGNMKV